MFTEKSSADASIKCYNLSAFQFSTIHIIIGLLKTYQITGIEVIMIMKITEPTMEQMKELYEVANVIKMLKPWERLWDTDIISIQLPDREEPVFCSVLGKGGECYGVLVYTGYESMSGFYRMIEAKNVPGYILMSYQNCLACNFGDRNELSEKDYKVVKELGFNFRGKNQWIYFKSHKTGFYPWYISCEQADILIETLQNFAMAYKYIIENKIEVNFKNHKTLLRMYSTEKESWLNSEAPMPVMPPMECKKIIATDELYVAKLKKQKKNSIEIEMDLFYVPASVQENKDEIPYYPRMCIIADKTNGIIIDQYLLNADDQEEQIFMGMFHDLVMQHGRPQTICVRDDKIERYLNDICHKIGIKIKKCSALEMIDYVVEGFISSTD